jgi:hypothetical protein
MGWENWGEGEDEKRDKRQTKCLNFNIFVNPHRLCPSVKMIV